MAVQTVEMALREPDLAHSVLTELYCPEQPLTFSGTRGPFVCDLRAATAGGLGTDRLRFSVGMQVELAPMDRFYVATGVRGSCRYTVGRDDFRVRPGAVFRYPDDAAFGCKWQDIEVVTMRLPLAVLERVAAERFGTPGEDLRFEGRAPVSEAKRRGWTRLMRFVHDQFADQDAAVSDPLVATALTDLVATTALTTFGNTALSSGRRPGPEYVAPAALRRAIAFVDEHAPRPITVSDIAEAAGVGARALQLAFRRHLGLSPMAYVRRVRLEGAHHELRTADPATGITVAAVARRWGFAKPDRFTAAYREAFGVLPSHTLRT